MFRGPVTVMFSGLAMRICALTQNEAVSTPVRDGTRATAFEVFPSGEQLIARLTDPNRENPRFIFIDITSCTDGLRALQFIKSSSVISKLTVIMIARLDQATQLLEGSQPDAIINRRSGGLSRRIKSACLMECPRAGGEHS